MMTMDLNGSAETKGMTATKTQLAELRALDVIIGEFWAKLRQANPVFDFPAPTEAEGAIYCLQLVMDWVLSTQGCWRKFSRLYREAEIAQSALKDGALLH